MSKVYIFLESGYFDGATGTTLFADGVPFSRGGTLPTILLALSLVVVALVVVALLLFISDNLSFFKLVALLPLFEGADTDPPNRVVDVEESVLLPLPILFGRLELDVSENRSDLAPPPLLLLEPPL